MVRKLLILICLTNKTNGSDELSKIDKIKTNNEINDDSLNSENAKTKQIQETIFVAFDEKWIEMALKDVAYYLRNHKFNEWDRRFYSNKSLDREVGFYKAFPEPKLKYLDHNVNENCISDFYKCITYLHSVIENIPVTRVDDLATKLIERNDIPLEKIKSMNADCMKALQSADETGSPFNNPLERFNWRTSASYYMCLYTMQATPALSMLGEPCDNHANCLSPEFGAQNHDPRANDKKTFSCALYSFCPDPCCKLKQVKHLSECSVSKDNPCYLENIEMNRDKTCTLDKSINKHFRDIMDNKWNVSCKCRDPGFIWKSQYGMCVDINECTMNSHNCALTSELCYNLPGGYDCICNVGYSYNRNTKKCKEDPIRLHVQDKSNVAQPKSFFEITFSILNRFLQRMA